MHLVFQSDDPQLVKLIAWSPDGESVAVMLENGVSYLIDADCYDQPNGCDESSRTEIGAIPKHWMHNFYPQWVGEEEARLPSAEATPVPQPTATPTPCPSVADQARAFAEPILTAIADRPPDYKDDFEDPSSGWRVESGESGEIGYQDGEYLIIANPHPDYPQECCGCYYNSPPGDPWFSDFVLEVDLRIVSGDSEHWDVFFRRTDASTYAAMFSLPRDLTLMKMVTELQEDTGLATHHGPPINGGYGTNHLQIIAKGSHMAVYANREPLWLVEDNAAERGQIVLGGCSHSDTPLHIRYDNLKIWDISDLALPSAEAMPAPTPTATPPLSSPAEQARAFAEPILAAIADRPPDYKDDFSDPASGWNVGTVQNEWEDGERGYADGEYFIIASPADGAGGHTCISGIHARQLIFSDFVLDVDGRFISSGVGDWQVQFREWWMGELEGEGKYSAGINADGVAYIN
jgi:hypothetical protein